jgi:hypothetical protein
MNDAHSSPPLSGGAGFDSRDSEILIDVGPGDTTVRPIRPSRMQQALAERERIACWQAPLDNKPPSGAEPPGA